MDIEELLMTADFSRNPAHREALRQRLFGADGRGLRNMNPDDDELSEDMLEQAAGGAKIAPDWRSLYDEKN